MIPKSAIKLTQLRFQIGGGMGGMGGTGDIRIARFPSAVRQAITQQLLARETAESILGNDFMNDVGR